MRIAVQDCINHRGRAAARDSVGPGPGGEPSVSLLQTGANHNASFMSQRLARPCVLITKYDFDAIVHHRFGVSEPSGGVGGATSGVRLEAAQLRNDLPPNSSAEVVGVVIGRVVAPVDTGEAADPLGVVSFNLKHRANEKQVGAERSAIRHSRETGDSGAADKRHQHGLQLIVRMVGRRDETTFAFGCHFCERIQPNAPRACFLIPRREVNHPFNHREPKPRGKVSDGIAIRVRLGRRTHVVNHVTDHDAIRSRETQGQGQRHRIGPT